MSSRAWDLLTKHNMPQPPPYNGMQLVVFDPNMFDQSNEVMRPNSASGTHQMNGYVPVLDNNGRSRSTGYLLTEEKTQHEDDDYLSVLEPQELNTNSTAA